MSKASAAFPEAFAMTPEDRRLSALRSPNVNTPSTASPGPGWLMASDGQWYPQQWEYMWTNTHESDLTTVRQEASDTATRLGLEGWEMVKFQALPCQGYHRVVGEQHRTVNETWLITCSLKRPRLPA
jgi:hypothetical protein